MTRKLGAILALLLTACGGYTESHEVVLREVPPPTGRRPELYFDGRQPDQGYYDVALIQIVGYGGDAELEDVTRALVARGGELGCDAILRVHVDVGYSKGHAYGVCVRYAGTPAPAAQPLPAPPPVPAPPAVPAPPPPQPQGVHGV
jgi:hypothetical protein